MLAFVTWPVSAPRRRYRLDSCRDTPARVPCAVCGREHVTWTILAFRDVPFRLFCLFVSFPDLYSYRIRYSTTSRCLGTRRYFWYYSALSAEEYWKARRCLAPPCGLLYMS